MQGFILHKSNQICSNLNHFCPNCVQFFSLGLGLHSQFIRLFHLYPPDTRKRRWRYILDESAPA